MSGGWNFEKHRFNGARGILLTRGEKARGMIGDFFSLGVVEGYKLSSVGKEGAVGKRGRKLACRGERIKGLRGGIRYF